MNTQNQAAQSKRHEFVYPGLSLAVYREIVAHLRQVDGVDAGLTPQLGQFDYCQSQIGSLWIQYCGDIEPRYQEQAEKILTYYSKRFGIQIQKGQ